MGARFILTSLLLTALLSPRIAAAEDDGDRSGSPYFETSAGSFPLEETRADVAIAGVIARVRVTQVYRNEGSNPIEAKYVFPASTRAAVFGMRMRIGSRTIEAKIAERKAAKKIYEDAKDDGKTAGLLEQHRANVFEMSVANIMPGDRVETVLDYTELLIPDGGKYAFIYPTVVGPRYTGNRGASSGVASARPEEGWTANPTLVEGAAPTYKFGLSAKISAGMPVARVRSPTHEISPRFEKNGVVRVELEGEQGGDRDFILEYSLAGEEIQSGLLLFPGARENYFLMMLQPPERVEPAMIPPREYVFIVDVSGSMNGFPIETAKETVRKLLDDLRVEDKFNILTFAGGSALLAEESLYATPENVERAMREIDHLQGSGGTEILSALRRGLELPRTKEMVTTFAVITDGFIDVEPEVFNLIRGRLGEANLFAFGIGTSVNRLLIEGMARAGRGEPFVVDRAAEAGEKAAAFRHYIESPVLTDVKVAFEGFQAYDVEPPVQPALFASRPVIVFGKYRGSASGIVRVSGANAQGRIERMLDVAQFTPSDDNAALRWLWARDRIARLADISGVLAEEDPKITKEVTRLGLEHSLLTAFTSFVAVDNLVRNTTGRPPERKIQPLPLPRGVSMCELGGGGPSFGMRQLLPRSGGAGSGASGSGSGSGSASAYGSGYGGLGSSGVGHGGGGYGAGIGGLGSYGIGRGGGGVSLGGRGKAATRVVPGKTIVMGGLDKDTIARVIRRNLARVKFCYEKELNRSPNLAGRLVVRFTIGANGSVVAASIKESTVGDDVVEQCVLAVMRSLTYPAVPGGGVIDVTYPFVFSVSP